DGRYISVGALEHRFWENLCQHLDFPEYINLQYSQEKRTEIIQAISKRFKQKTLEQWEKELSETDTCCQGIRTLEEVLHHPLFKQREMVFDSQGPDGKSEFCLGVPVKLSQTPGYVRRPPKKFGQDTLSILSELNYSQAEIDDFMQEEVI
ncbi:MAG TPA: CoA transferase, partial [Desulfohalobiaceae bacterium]|nr:CoA transferase [Desulfohalobiaceae bacterium]